MDTNLWQPQGLDVPAAHGVSQAQSKHPVPCAERRMKREARERERNFSFMAWSFSVLRDILIKQTSPAKWNVPRTLCQNRSLNQMVPEVQNFPFFHLLGCHVTGNGNMAVLLPRQSSWAPEPDSAVKYSGWILGWSKNRSEVKISMKSESYLDYVTFLWEHLDYLNFDFI